MGLNNKTNLKSQAELIRDEQDEGKNTAKRVGDTLVGIIENADQSLTTETTQRQQKDNALENSLNIASNTATTAYNEAKEAKTAASQAKTAAAAAQSTADQAKTTANAAKAVTDKRGMADGICPLGHDAKVPSAFLPSYVDDVVEFNAMVDDITLQTSQSPKASTDAGCMIVYHKSLNTFLLAVSRLAVAEGYDWGSTIRPGFIATIQKTESEIQPLTLESGVSAANKFDATKIDNNYWQISDNGASVELITSVFDYYAKWSDDHNFGTESNNGSVPESGKVYICTSDNKTFRWSGSTLVGIGSDLALGYTANSAFPGNEGQQLRDELRVAQYQIQDNFNRLQGLGILPADGYWDGTAPRPESGVWLCPSEEDSVYFRSFGNTNFYGIAEENYNSDMTYNTGWLYRLPDGIYRINNNNFESISGSSIGNCYNITIERIANDEKVGNGADAKYYDDFASAVEYLISKNKASLGMQITYAQALKSWKTWQYVGGSTEPDDLRTKDNWIDMAGLSAGQEPVINVNLLCGDKDYTIFTAIAAVLALKTTTGIDYRKPGMILTYRRDQSSRKWECKQFTGENVDDITDSDDGLWVDFGGGGGISKGEEEVKPGSDLPPSSQAVIDYVKENAIVDYDDVSTAEEIIYQGKNANDKPLGNPIKIPRSSGGGTQTGSTLNIYPESQSVWGAFGGKIVLRAAIKSVSFDGDDEILGTIKSVSILDPLTNMVLWTDSPNITGSATATDYKFDFDFTDFITEASSKEFLLEAIDADGNRKTKQVSVNAVDVTVQAVNALNYSADKHLAVGGSTMSISMYKFANNISTRQGILCTTEMFYNGEWRVLGTATITDNYSHNISINPNDVFGGGEKLTHGSYPIRIHGRDLASGVEGNTAYTAVMCVDPSSSKPLVSMRYDDRNNGKVRLYDSISVDIAAYTPGRTTTAVEVILDGHVISTVNCDYSQTYNVSKQIQGYASNGTVTLPIHAQSKGTGEAGSIQRSVTIEVTVDGSAIDAALKDGAVFTYDFSTRSNDEADHTISDSGVEMSVVGANWNSNGFVNMLGENVLRIAENVKAEIPYAPFASTALETSGCAIQMAFSTKNIKDKNAKLCECYDPASGVGFYIQGNKIVLNVQNGTPTTQNVKFKCNEKITLAVVVEPGSKTVTYKSDDSATGTEYSFVKMYVNGEEVAAIGYQPNTNALRQNRTITFDSTNGDFCLNYLIAYNSHMEWLQAFRNYLCKMSDVTAMIAEYDKENVLDTTGRPSMSLMAAAGIPYYVIVADQTTFDNYDFALNGGTSTSDVFSCTLYYFNPQHPEVNFKAVNTYWRRQGTTSAQRPIKNDRFNFNKKFKTGVLKGQKATVTLLNPDESTQLGRDAILAAKHNKVYCSETGFFVDVVTVKVDYSDSSTANDCGVCNMMNATFRALGSSYMTPAQRAFTGVQDLGGGDVITARQMDHSTKNHPIACFRATTDTLQDAWFHARGNWKEDKGEQVALGFKDTPGYNLGCLNYGDFVEFFGNSVWENGEFKSQETLAEIEARFKKTADLDTSKIYLLSQYCGQDYAIYRYKNGSWVRSTGSMKQVNGRWVITGDVLNPVSGYELLQYNGMDWFQGVSSITDMMKPSTRIASWVNKLDNKPANPPAWTYYFECMIDDDQLQEDLAFGRKVPYDLFNLLRFMDSCDYSKESLASTWKNVWKENAYKYMSMESAMAYTAFTDFLAAVDQRAKNMQPMFFLEDGCSVENGVYVGYRGMNALRMYLNKVYDCDTCNGADNDGGRDIDAEVDPNKQSDAATGYVNPYMGRGSILFNNIDKCPEVWNSNDLGNTTITLQNVVNTMRTRTAQVDGKTMVPFSPDGAMYYFVEQRLNFWPKTVATYDCERKYIENTHRANLPYFYALHGLGLTSLPRFIEQRWSIRDCYYKTGDFYTNPLKVRMVALNANSKIPFTAGQTGYFGIGNDAGGATSEFVFLEAGQSHEFTIFEHGECEMSIYQVGRMSKLDLSEMCLGSNINTQLSKLALAEEIILGGSKHTANISTGGYGEVGSLELDELPFLRKLDVSNTTCSGVNASKCPRIEEINAKNTNVARCDVAQTAPIETMVLPSAVTRLDLVNLPRLTYPGGLELASVGNITHLRIEGCPYVDTEGLTLSVAQTGKLKEIRIPDVNITASVNVLRLLKQAGVQGLSNTGSAYGEEGKCSGLIGRWILSELIDEDGADGLNSLNAYFPELNIINSQFSMVVYNDAEDDSENISNLDNKTGYLFGNEFVPSGHVKKLEDMSHGVRGTYDTEQEAMIVEELSDEDYNLLADGTSIDLTDSSGMGYDFFKDVPEHWYKGVNDFKNQQKYGIRSICENEPISTSTKVSRAKLADLLVEANAALVLSSNPIGGEPSRSLNSAMNVYEMNVSGMRQVRWPGVNNDAIGCVFLDADGKIMSQFKMAVSHAQFDFIAGEDYIFTDVPSGAVKFMFTSQIGCDDQEAIAVDSSAIEAIEPDWVRSKEFLVGIYGMGQDGLNRARSISGTKAVVGTGTSTTSSAWTYDSEGRVTNLSVPANLNRTRQDCINLCEMRGKGFHAISYQQSSILANIIMELTGTRDIQSICGRGNSAGYNTGTQTINGKNINAYGNITLRHNAGNVGNLMFGIQEFVGCNYEWMSGVVVNAKSFKHWKAQKCPTTDSSYPIDMRWHIYNHADDTERAMQGMNPGNSGYCVARVRFGRYMDYIPSKVTNDNSQYNKNYGDGAWYVHDRCRVVGRAHHNANAGGGLVYSHANYVSTVSNTSNGSRLAFSGKIIHKSKQAA